MSTPEPASQPNFDHIARPYRWLELLTLSSSLQSCRLHFLAHLTNRSRALIIGDGDGRFLARLMQHNPKLKADAVDTSATMLHLLRERCHRASPSATSRLTTHQSDAIAYVSAPNQPSYDLVATHFFLDCLTQRQVTQLANLVAAHVAPGALWVVSDFSIPSGALRLLAKLFIRALYLAFRVLTGLPVSHLPDHRAALTEAGFTLLVRHRALFGVLTSELWTANPLARGKHGSAYIAPELLYNVNRL